MDSTAFKNEIWDFLRALHEYTDRTFHSILEEYGLTMMQARILGELTFGDLTIGSLAECVGILPANASVLCKKMEQQGLLRRFRRPEDERYVTLTLTDAGRQTAQEAISSMEEKYGPFLREKSGEELEEMMESMKKIREFMQEMCEYHTKN